MKEAIESANNRLKELYAEAERLNTFIRAARDVCTHEWEDAPDLYDYHKRESYSRCKVCGKTV